uniref:G_PROTEIN_RECEP_F2_4 domain-containing protein n=2 Tax=Meloidogyne hapla TaxID=6305 RepID=A0A1I8B9K7_MELHA
MACNYLTSGIRYLIIEGPHGNKICFLNFIFFYFGSIAGNCWWLILGFTWYLSASRKWVEEEIGKRSILLHLFAWGLPCLLAIISLSNNLVDASELTGICSLGNFAPLTLFWFWIFPRILITLIGFFLLLAGFSSMCKERNKFKNRGTDTSRLEKFLLKMGIFSLIYLFSILLNSLCDLHHLIVISEWQPNTINCKTKGGTFSGNCIRPEQPEPKLYVFGQTMGMATGLAVGLCILSPKTLATMSSLSNWKKALICCWPLQTKNQINNTSFKKKQLKQTLITSFPPQNSSRNILPSSSIVYNSQQNNQNLNNSKIVKYIPLSNLSQKSKEIKNTEQIYEHQNVGIRQQILLEEEQSNAAYL